MAVKWFNSLDTNSKNRLLLWAEFLCSCSMAQRWDLPVFLRWYSESTGQKTCRSHLCVLKNFRPKKLKHTKDGCFCDRNTGWNNSWRIPLPSVPLSNFWPNELKHSKDGCFFERYSGRNNSWTIPLPPVSLSKFWQKKLKHTGNKVLEI